MDVYERYREGQRLLADASPEAAVTVLEPARDAEPDQSSIREALGRAYFRCRRFAAAEAEFAKAVELEPVNDYALFGLGLCRLRVGDRDGARGHLRLAAAMRPERMEYRRALARAVEPA
jgi:Flp pilus assembly protein TadD